MYTYATIIIILTIQKKVHFKDVVHFKDITLKIYFIFLINKSFLFTYFIYIYIYIFFLRKIHNCDTYRRENILNLK